jgi:hypothetical protein
VGSPRRSSSILLLAAISLPTSPTTARCPLQEGHRCEYWIMQDTP